MSVGKDLCVISINLQFVCSYIQSLCLSWACARYTVVCLCMCRSTVTAAR